MEGGYGGVSSGRVLRSKLVERLKFLVDPNRLVGLKLRRRGLVIQTGLPAPRKELRCLGGRLAEIKQDFYTQDATRGGNMGCCCKRGSKCCVVHGFA